jgi:enoyl-CoA hydratase
MQRPDRLNALNAEVLDEFAGALDELRDRDDVRAIVLRGAGRAFIAGADIEAMMEMSPDEGEDFAEKGHETLEALENFPAPVIAAVDGFALGGGLEVALACDLIYASGRAQFGLPEVSLGIIPGFGGTQRLARFIGWQHARELVYTARRISADEAERIGLACHCFEVDNFDERVREVAELIASRGPLAVRGAKQVMRTGEDASLEQGLEAERETFRELFDTADRAEGMEAFVDGRDPDFRGE